MSSETRAKEKGWPTKPLSTALASGREVLGGRDCLNREPEATKCSLKQSRIADLSEIGMLSLMIQEGSSF